jgi:hypothetical protein
MVKCVREQFFINVTDILDNEGKSNPKTHGSLVKNERVNQPHHLYHLYRTRLLVSLPHHLYHLYRTTGEFVVNDEDEANLLYTFFCSISEIVNSDLSTPVFGKRTGRELDGFNITFDEIKDGLLNL